MPKGIDLTPSYAQAAGAADPNKPATDVEVRQNAKGYFDIYYNNGQRAERLNGTREQAERQAENYRRDMPGYKGASNMAKAILSPSGDLILALSKAEHAALRSLVDFAMVGIMEGDGAKGYLGGPATVKAAERVAKAIRDA